jgi:hypothetical protein
LLLHQAPGLGDTAAVDDDESEIEINASSSNAEHWVARCHSIDIDFSAWRFGVAENIEGLAAIKPGIEFERALAMHTAFGVLFWRIM